MDVTGRYLVYEMRLVLSDGPGTKKQAAGIYSKQIACTRALWSLEVTVDHSEAAYTNHVDGKSCVLFCGEILKIWDDNISS